RSVRTVTRWERDEGLPVHRHLHAKAGSVYAYKSELDAWWASRGPQIDRLTSETASDTALRRRRACVAAAAAAAVLASAAIVWTVLARRWSTTASTLVPLTTYPGIEGPPSLSPDGNQVTFERDGDLFVKQVDGEALVRLTSTGATEHSPAWSPDGRLIAFV